MPRVPDDAVAPGRFWRVGELSERTGLTVRTLHHYDAVGLLSPSVRTRSAHGSGHRLYNASDVARLQQIVSLKQLGFGLEQIREYLDRVGYDPRQVVRLHLERVRSQIAELKRLERRLTHLADAMEKAEIVSADEFVNTIGEMTVIEKYYTPEQLEQLAARKEQVGEERIRQVQQEWEELIADVTAAKNASVDPTDPRVQEMAKKWFGLVNEFTGGDPGIFQSLKTMYQNEDRVHGRDVAEMKGLMEYLGKGISAAEMRPDGS